MPNPVNAQTAITATAWSDTTIAITLFVLVGALVLLVVWQVFSVVKKGMDLRDSREDRNDPSRT